MTVATFNTKSILTRLSVLVTLLGIASSAAVASAQGRAAMRMQRMLELQQLQQQELQPDRPQVVEPNAPPPPEVDGLAPWLKQFHESVPQTSFEFADFDVAAFTKAGDAVEQWINLWGRVAAGQQPPEQINIMGRLLDARQFVDRELDNVLATRVRLAAIPDDQQRRAALRGYLLAASKLIDLSGRLRYDMIDILDETAGRFSEQPALRERLVDSLAEKQSTIGAVVMSSDMFDPAALTPDPTTGGDVVQRRPQANPISPQIASLPPRARRQAMRALASTAKNTANGSSASSGSNLTAPNSVPSSIPPLSTAQKLKVIKLLAAAGNVGTVYDLADFVQDENTPPSLVLAAAEAIRALGLPQDPRPGQDDAVVEPAITAAKLRERLSKIEPSEWKSDERHRVDALLAWLSDRSEHGLEGNTYRVGQFDVQPGDWLLMRNPSPYNLFTDLSPGLFTHVGVVALEKGSDDKRRMVIVDLEERGTRVPATNVETFLDRTLNYVFLRHPDPAVARKMGEAAASMIGNPAEFDLNFRTDRIADLKNVDLKGQKIHTYCAGLLLLCAQQTDLPREVFFPVIETTAAGHTKENIAKFGLSLGDGFVSPTGALFSSKLQIVGRGEPMYDPDREIQEAVYDRFAQMMAKREMRPTPDLFQAMRLKFAEASQSSQLLARMLAASANVSAQMDLVSAAKAAAVIEALDEIAYGASRDFETARDAIVDGGQAQLTPTDLAQSSAPQQNQLTPEQRASIDRYRSRHAELAIRWDQREISPRNLRVELMRYYIQQGYRQLDERFGGGEK